MMYNLDKLRKLISTAMRDGKGDVDKSVTIPLETASMIVVEYEKHRVAASKLKGDLKRCQKSLAERDDDKVQS